MQVYLRAGWSLGNVQDRYIIAGAGGDQLVGRAVSGLPVHDQKFTVLPPHFKSSDIEYLTSFGWENILEGYEHYPLNFRKIVPFLLASIIHHEEALRLHLSPDHLLWKQRIYNHKLPNQVIIANYLRGKVLIRYGHCEDANMHATGIPSHLAIAHEVHKLSLKVQAMEEANLNNYNELKEILRKEFTDIPNAVKDSILNNFQMNGVVPLNMNDLQRVIAQHHGSIMSEINSIVQQLNNNNNRGIANNDVTINHQHNEIIEDELEAVNLIGCTYFVWGGKMGRLVPQNYQFPQSIDVKTLWDLWHYGVTIDANHSTYPLKRLQLKRHIEDVNRLENKTNITRASKLMSELHKIAEELQLIEANKNITTLNRTQSDNIFNASYEKLLRNLYPPPSKGPKRKYETVYSTIVNKIYKPSRNNANDTDEAVSALQQLHRQEGNQN